MKALSIRLDDRLARRFDKFCRKTGYKKNTFIVRLIESTIDRSKKFLSAGTRKKRDPLKDDPFLKVIGIVKDGPILKSPEEIDEIVYGL